MASGVSIILPSEGFAPSPDQEEVILLHASGFPDRGLAALYLFNEPSGTKFKDAMGGGLGTLDSITNSNNAFSRLANGGVSLSGAQFISFPAYEAHAPWSLITGGGIVGDAGSESEKITGFLGHRSAYGTGARGSYLYARGAPSWATPAAVTDYYQHRTNGGGTAVDAALSPIDNNAASVRYLIAHSYDGTSTLTSTLFNAGGVPVITGQIAATPEQLFVISGETVSMLIPILGGLNDVFDGAILEFEFLSRYTLALTSMSAEEIQVHVAAAVQLGSARGRAWS